MVCTVTYADAFMTLSVSGDIRAKTCVGAVCSIFENVVFCSFQIRFACPVPIVMAGFAKICVDIASSDLEV